MREKVVAFIGAVLLLILLTAGCGRDTGATGPPLVEPGLKVVTTTSLIEDIVTQVGRERVTVVNIVPPASCPGHFDVKPGDMRVLAGARLFLVHDWQGETFTAELIASARNPDLETVVLGIRGNWLTPPVQAEAIEAVTVALEGADPENAAFYRANAGALQETVAATGREAADRLAAARVDGVKVLGNDMLTGFLEWAGYEVVGSFGAPDDTSPKEMEALLQVGREAGVVLVIDNLQSGHEAGVAIARELGARHVTLSNFPGGLEGTDTWALTVVRNTDLLLGAME